MNKAQFRWLLIGYGVIVIMGFISDQYSHLVIPDAVLKLEPSYLAESMSLRMLQLVYVPILGSAGLIGIIGMFCLWSPGRYIFLLGVAMKILGAPLFFSWGTSTGWSALFTGIAVILEGTILTLSLFGPAKDLFAVKKKKSRRSLQHLQQ